MTRRLRFVAGTLALALPLVAAAGCGAAKKKTVREEFSAAQEHLADSKAASFTLKLSDAQGNLAKLLTKEGDAPPALVQALLKGSVTYTADPAGDATFRSAQAAAVDSTDLSAALAKVNIGFVIRDDKAELLEIRMVGGNLYAHLNLDEIAVLAKAGGVEDFDASLDEGFADMDPRFTQGLSDVRAGKWLSLPVAKYLTQLQELAGTLVPGATPDPSKEYDFSGMGMRAFDAVKPFVKVTDANDSSEDRVLDVAVQARPALKALLAVLKAEKELPFGALFADVDASEIDKSIKPGEAKGTITLKDSHLSKVSVDLESLRQLSNDAGEDSFAGVNVVVEVDDAADQLAVPTNVSSLDLGALIEELISGFFGVGATGTLSQSATGYAIG